MHNEKLALIEFKQHRGSSEGRGVEFRFSFEQWVAWWRASLGPQWQTKRGRGKGKYCMARNGDKGPYAAENVKCVPFEVNSREAQLGSRSARSNINYNLARLIFLEEGVTRQIARKYEVTPGVVRGIKQRGTWVHATCDLVRKPGMRGPQGELSGTVALREYEVLYIFYSKLKNKELNKLFGVSYQCILDIKSKRRWVHLTADLNQKYPPPIKLR